MTDTDRETWFVEQVLPHEAALRTYLARFLSRSDDIDDTLQDTYARLITLSEAERGRIRQAHAFLFVTARNVALDRLRKQQVVSLDTLVEIGQLDVVDESAGGYEEINARQELALLRRAIAALPERCRQVLTLRKIYGMSQREIATELAISENTVERHIANGMRACAAYLAAITPGGGAGTRSRVALDQPQRCKDVE